MTHLEVESENGHASLEESHETAAEETVPEETPDATAPEPADVEFTASVFPGRDGSVPREFAERVIALEALLGGPVWVLVQHGSRRPYDELDEYVRRAFFSEREHLMSCGANGGGASILIDSPGGQAQSAYQIATLFRRHCNGFAAIVPRMAKSAATLLTLGAETIYLGRDAELGPLDVQLWDVDREEFASALDEVQALERLNSVALGFVDQAMFLLVGRTGKKVDALLPAVLHFATELMHPLLDKIDTVHYTSRARVLKVAEDYATRLLQPRYAEADADDIARRLVNAYSEHAFVIDREELEKLLPLTLAPGDTDKQPVIDELEELLTTKRFTAIGRIERRSKDGAQ